MPLGLILDLRLLFYQSTAQRGRLFRLSWWSPEESGRKQSPYKPAADQEMPEGQVGFMEPSLVFLCPYTWV